MLASGAVVKLDTWRKRGSNLPQVFRWICCLSLAVLADRTHEALSEKATDHAGQQEGLDTHTQQACDTTRGIVGMERGENRLLAVSSGRQRQKVDV
jgi:hypothetical protein